MDTIFSFTLRGTKAANEDIFGRAGSYAWMIDGATDLWPERHFDESDSRFLARLVSHELSCQIEGFPAPSEEGPVSCMRNALSSARKIAEGLCPAIAEVPAWELPSFAFMLVQDRHDGTIEAAALCDCHLFLDSGAHFTDMRFAPFEARNRRAIAALADDTLETRLAIYQKTRKLLNREDGYWVGTLDGKGVDHTVTERFAAPAGTKIALASDGFIAELQHDLDNGKDAFAAIPAATARLAASSGQNPQEHRDDASVLVVEI